MTCPGVHRQGRARIQCRDSCNFSLFFLLVMAVKISHSHIPAICFIQDSLLSLISYNLSLWPEWLAWWQTYDPVRTNQNWSLDFCWSCWKIVTLMGYWTKKICVDLLRAILVHLGWDYLGKQSCKMKRDRWGLGMLFEHLDPTIPETHTFHKSIHFLFVFLPVLIGFLSIASELFWFIQTILCFFH